MFGNKIASAHVTDTKRTVTMKFLEKKNTLTKRFNLRLLRPIILVEDKEEELLSARIVVDWECCEKDYAYGNCCKKTEVVWVK